MKNVKVKTVDLIKKLKENMEEHRKIFLDALEGYRKAAIEAFEANIKAARDGKPFTIYFGLREPKDQTKDYKRVIAMMEATIDTEIELTEAEFACYWMDNWHWQQEFLTSNAAYSMSASNKLSQMTE